MSAKPDSYRATPSKRYRFGVVLMHGQEFNNNAWWFRTKKAAEAFAVKHWEGNYAIVQIVYRRDY